MATYVALLRAINVAGHQMIAMSALRESIAALGFEDVQTILQSGNVILRGKTASTASIEKRLATIFPTDFFVRTEAEWSALIARNPFTREAKDDPARLVAMCLRDAPSKDSIAALREAIRGREYLEVHGREAYIAYPDGQGRSKLTNALIEKKLATRGTARNWNTVLRIAAAAE